MLLLRDELRAATRAEHEALERSLALGRADLDRDSYIAYLRGWLVFFRSIERDFSAGRELWDFTSDCHARIAWLEDDLRYLAGSTATMTIPTFTLRCRAVPELAGSSYVIEGAVLGAQVVYRQLNQRWRIEREKGGTFLWGYGPTTAGHWREFVAALNDLVLAEAERRVCAIAARSTFRLLEDAFSCNGIAGGFRR